MELGQIKFLISVHWAPFFQVSQLWGLGEGVRGVKHRWTSSPPHTQLMHKRLGAVTPHPSLWIHNRKWPWRLMGYETVAAFLANCSTQGSLCVPLFWWVVENHDECCCCVLSRERFMLSFLSSRQWTLSCPPVGIGGEGGHENQLRPLLTPVLFTFPFVADTHWN